MSRTTLGLEKYLIDYVRQIGVREPAAAKACREYTASLENANMQIAPEQGQLLYLITKMTSAKKIIEVGTFYGYSAIWMASALPEDGHLIACDVDNTYTSKAKTFWQQAGLSEKIQLQLAPAITTMDQLIQAEQTNQYDLVFIDADKVNYQNYLDRAFQLLRPGGVALMDNTLWSGSVAKDTTGDESTAALKSFNLQLHQDTRFDICLLPVGDGLSIALKK